MPRTKFTPANINLHVQLLVAHLFQLRKSHVYLNRLIGTSASSRLLPSEEGLIDKMKYCIRSLMDVYESGHLKAIEKSLDSAWMEAVAVSKKKSSPKILQKHLHILPSLVGEFLFSLAPDENLFFFLLRHLEECHETFGITFINNLFHSKHPQGLKQTERFILQRYQKRGFNHLRPVIQLKLTALTK